MDDVQLFYAAGKWIADKADQHHHQPHTNDADDAKAIYQCTCKRSQKRCGEQGDSGATTDDTRRYRKVFHQAREEVLRHKNGHAIGKEVNQYRDNCDCPAILAVG